MKSLFSEKTIDFLIENKLRNDRVWFEEHRDLYDQHVIAPLVSLVQAPEPVMMGIDNKLICSPKIGGSISRIWRDARRPSKDKTIFRDMMWCMFIRQKNMGLPEYFFLISPKEFLYGCGYYAASTATMESIRKLITSGSSEFKAALSAFENQDIFQIEGDFYKRSRFPDMPENLRSWMDRKTLSFVHRSNDFQLLSSEQLSDAVAEGFKMLAPIYDFFIKAEENANK